MTRNLFIETIEALKKQSEHDDKCAKAFQVILPDTHMGFYDNHFLTNQLVKILQVEMNDEGRDSWIEYYLWELDFGAKYKHGCATDHGKNINLSNAGKLYDFLIKNK